MTYLTAFRVFLHEISLIFVVKEHIEFAEWKKEAKIQYGG